MPKKICANLRNLWNAVVSTPIAHNPFGTRAVSLSVCLTLDRQLDGQRQALRRVFLLSIDRMFEVWTATDRNRVGLVDARLPSRRVDEVQRDSGAV